MPNLEKILTASIVILALTGSSVSAEPNNKNPKPSVQIVPELPPLQGGYKRTVLAPTEGDKISACSKTVCAIYNEDEILMTYNGKAGKKQTTLRNPLKENNLLYYSASIGSERFVFEYNETTQRMFLLEPVVKTTKMRVGDDLYFDPRNGTFSRDCGVVGWNGESVTDCQQSTLLETTVITTSIPEPTTAVSTTIPVQDLKPIAQDISKSSALTPSIQELNNLNQQNKSSSWWKYPVIGLSALVVGYFGYLGYTALQPNEKIKPNNFTPMRNQYDF